LKTNCHCTSAAALSIITVSSPGYTVGYICPRIRYANHSERRFLRYSSIAECIAERCYFGTHRSRLQCFELVALRNNYYKTIKEKLKSN